MLCSECESHFNFNYDIPLQRIIEQLHIKPTMSAEDAGIFSRSILSVAWRASKSNADIYRNFNLLPRIELAIRQCFSDSSNRSFSLYSVRVQKLYDHIFQGDVDVKQIIMSPKILKSQAVNALGLIFMFGGVVIEVVFPKLPRQVRNRSNYLKTGVTVNVIRSVSIYAVPSYAESIKHMLEKDREDHVTPSFRRFTSPN